MAKKVVIAYNSSDSRSLVCYALVRGYEKGSIIEALNTAGLDASSINTEIASLTDDQDKVYVALNDGDAETDHITTAQLESLEAKLASYNDDDDDDADNEDLVQWKNTDRTTEVSMSMQCWEYFNVDNSTAPSVIYFMCQLTSKLSAEEIAQGDYYEAAIVPYFNKITTTEVETDDDDDDDDADTEFTHTLDFDETLLRTLSDSLDRGFFSKSINTALEGGLPTPKQDELVKHDLLMIGETLLNYLEIEDKIVVVEETDDDDDDEA